MGFDVYKEFKIMIAKIKIIDEVLKLLDHV
jgi:hypothetical protein